MSSEQEIEYEDPEVIIKMLQEELSGPDVE